MQELNKENLFMIPTTTKNSLISTVVRCFEAQIAN